MKLSIAGMAGAASVALALAGCGGGGGDGDSPASGTLAPQTTTLSSLCGQAVGSGRLQGTVTSVHDGDTLTLQTADGTKHPIRLDGIDAPELAQPAGPASQAALAAAVLGKAVTVAYAQTDLYGRTVGSVFTDACGFVNRDQLSAGLAWFYKAYQCELSGATREQFLQAQASAQQSGRGLWSQADPEAPWFYRNGTEPQTPVCTSDMPSWAGATTSSGTTSGGATTGASSGGGTGAVCHVGPRGGTYTITSSGTKNYSGC